MTSQGGAEPRGALDVGGDTVLDVVAACPAFLDDGGRADGERTGRHDGVVEHDGVGADDRPAVDDDTVQHDRADADQAPRLDRASLEVHEVADHAVVADDRGVLVRRVQHAVVLHAGALADDDLAVVAAQHCARPDGAVGTDRHVADDDRVGVHIGVADGWTGPGRRGRRWARLQP